MMNKRQLLTRIVQGFGITGAAFLAWPFLRFWLPALEEDASQEVDIGGLRPGETRVVRWRGRNVFIRRRTREAIAALETPLIPLKDPASEQSTQPAFAQNPYRSLRPDIFIAYTNCTHLGCELATNDDRTIGFQCPCHQSEFDQAGRVTDTAAAPVNLEVPFYRFISGNVVRLDVREPG
ncbi:MAG: ubiquinol-cytochrome c reductase iron-sulfur subunit [Pseudomonadales bacterium]|nr:ubiquinol-cytochrome c reductase iron-sulfur subunit [Pseudomonadales bacterium]